MASIPSFAFRSDWVRVAALCIVLLVSASVHAEPTNCDDDMTEDQRFQVKLCSAHAGCRFVFGIADSCVKAKSFLSKLGLGGNLSKNSAEYTTDVSLFIFDKQVRKIGTANGKATEYGERSNVGDMAKAFLLVLPDPTPDEIMRPLVEAERKSRVSAFGLLNASLDQLIKN